jgi:maltose O-acetyltransferase
MSRRWRGTVANVIAGSAVWGPGVRVRMLRLLGVRIGSGTRVYPYVRFIGRVDLLQLGRGCFVNTELLVGSNAPIDVGDRVSMGPRVQLLPTSHELGPSTARAGATTSAPISIGAGSWLGAGVTVLGGVSIGPGCVIAAGAVVTEDCAADSLYAGVPARLIRSLEPQTTRREPPDEAAA